ncbi:MAG: thioredoxin-dependent thiol peroxidase [Candidatus Hodarchaeota archaeon]
MTGDSLKVGQVAPKFCLSNQDGNEICLKDFQGDWVVLYFYPKDKSKACTLEALDFTALKPQFEKHNAKILGISKDSVKSHQSFASDKGLGILLLSDPEADVQKKYGVWRLKKFMGREYVGTIRSTFLIDPEGKIVKIWDNVRVKGHAEEVLGEVRKSSSGK